MSDVCKTVKIKAETDSGFIIINESDFDADKHVLYDAKAPVKGAGRKKRANA